MSRADQKMRSQKLDTLLQSMLAALALAGVGVGVALTQHYYEVRSGVGSFHSFCNLGSAVNCDAVAASPYAELFRQLPVSAFATGWFVALYCIACMTFVSRWKKAALQVSFMLTCVGSVLCLFYFGVMIGIVKTYCLLCLVTDVLMLSSLGVTLRLGVLKERRSLRFDFSVKQGLAMGVLILTSIALSVGVLSTWMNSTSYDLADVDRYVDQLLAAPTFTLASQAQGPAFGLPAGSPPILIVEFSDFQCPYCRLGALSAHAVMVRYPEKIRMEFRNYPLDQKCNPDIKMTVHPVACESAAISYCAHQQGRFESVYELLFENQAQLAPGRAFEFAKSVGVEAGLLQKCMDAPETALSIAHDVQEGKTLGIQGTPVFFVNGHKIEGTIPLVVWSRIIDRLLDSGEKK